MKTEPIVTSGVTVQLCDYYRSVYKQYHFLRTKTETKTLTLRARPRQGNKTRTISSKKTKLTE